MASQLKLIGIGAGNPEWVTGAAARAVRELDVLFVVIKEKELDEFVEVRRQIVEEHRSAPLRTVELHDPPRPWRSTPDYPAAVRTWRQQRLQQWSDAVAAEIGEGQAGGFLVWGDPSLYESTLAIVKELVRISDREIGVQVIPGISSVLALAAAHQIPLNRQGRAVVIEPARLLADGMPEGTDDVVAMLDGHQTFANIDPAGLDIYWGAYLGTADEILISGDLAAVREEILEVRAAAVARKGWIFDTYLIRRRI